MLAGTKKPNAIDWPILSFITSDSHMSAMESEPSKGQKFTQSYHVRWHKVLTDVLLWLILIGAITSNLNEAVQFILKQGG